MGAFQKAEKATPLLVKAFRLVCDSPSRTKNISTCIQLDKLKTGADVIPLHGQAA